MSICGISLCISYQLMVDAVLEIMQKAVVPWSNVVEKLVQQYLEMDGPKYDFFFNLVKIGNIICFYVIVYSLMYSADKGF